MNFEFDVELQVIVKLISTMWQYWMFLSMNIEYLSTYLITGYLSLNFIGVLV